MPQYTTKKAYIESIYDKIIISLRNKGMPKVNNEYCEPWIFNDVKPDGSIKYKGSLDILELNEVCLIICFPTISVNIVGIVLPPSAFSFFFPKS